MLTRVLLLRYAYVIAVVFTLINSVVFLISGVHQSIEGYVLVLPAVVLVLAFGLFLMRMREG